MNFTCDKCEHMLMIITNTEVVQTTWPTPGTFYQQTQECTTCGRTLLFSIPCVELSDGKCSTCHGKGEVPGPPMDSRLWECWPRSCPVCKR